MTLDEVIILCTEESKLKYPGRRLVTGSPEKLARMGLIPEIQPDDYLIPSKESQEKNERKERRQRRKERRRQALEYQRSRGNLAE